MITKQKLEELMRAVPTVKDTEIKIVKTMGDSLIIFNYELERLKLYDTYLEFTDNEKTYKIMYHNIIQIKWRPIFKDKMIRFTTDGEIINDKQGTENIHRDNSGSGQQ